MEMLALGVGVVALLVGLVALMRSSSIAGRLAQIESDSGRRASSAGKELEQDLANLRRIVAALAGGAELDAEQVREGRLWRDVDGAKGKRLVDERRARLLDVRTPHETAGGIVPGALLVPVDQLAERLAELPRDGRPTIVYCAMGGRSAFACELLASEGFDDVFNLEGGISAWGGPLEKP